MFKSLISIVIFTECVFLQCGAHDHHDHHHTCSASGDPHYHTFDGLKYDFMGACEHVLSKDLDNNFLVVSKNKYCYGHNSCVYSVSVIVKGLKIKISRGGHFSVFGIPKDAPYANQGVVITKDGGKTIRIETDIGFSFRFDRVYDVFVTVSSRYRGKTVGLCGNNNGDVHDEFIDAHMQKTNDVLHFANSWNVDRNCPSSPQPKNPCLTAGKVAQEAKKKCHLLKQQPFVKCHDSVNQDSGYIEDCEYDVCACNNHPSSCLCEEFAAYATSCSLVGVPIAWKTFPQFAECSAPCAAAPCSNGATCVNHGEDYKCSCTEGYTGKNCEIRTCQNPEALGMESGKIPDSRITASSIYDSNHAASNARLNFAKNSGSWSSRQNNVNQWLQVDFKYRATVTAILIQGRGRYNQWVKSYTVSSSDDGVNFKPYRKNGKDMVFVANNNQHSVVKNTLDPVIVARFIRIQPKSWSNHISLRTEFIGCFEGHQCAQEPCHEGRCNEIGEDFTCSCLAGYYGDRCEEKECKEPSRLGMEAGTIQNSQISASTEYDRNHAAYNARLNFQAQGHRQGGWSARHNNLNQWLQVNFKRQAIITEILTQGRSNAGQWVKSYTVSYSNNGVNL